MVSKEMKILVTGFTGQLGFDVVQSGLKMGLDVLGVGSRDLDITNEIEVTKFLYTVNPDAIIHCAAYTAVDKAEDDRDTCWSVNVGGTEFLAKAAKKIDAKFMYLSTDYVFSGEGHKPYEEIDFPNPIGFYGLTKFEGEKIVRRLLHKWFIVRISWAFGVNGNNFIKTMLRQAKIHNEINVVNDQIGSPTYTSDLARLLIEMISSDKYGIYHATNEGFCSWADFAAEIFRQAKINIRVNRISTEDYRSRSLRPKNSRLSKQKLIDSGFDPLPSWQDAVGRYLNGITTWGDIDD
jgi:dTDP-4-dehydrorhamnose reductase